MMASLAVAPITSQDASPTEWLVFLHGILGSGANWRTFARQIIAARPGWGALLVDLRLHGESQGFAPPDTVEAAARDIVERLPELPRVGPVRAVLGHSFGGKVAIELSRQLARSSNGAIDHLFVIDSTPGPRVDHRGSAGVVQIVELLTHLPSSFDDRAAFTAWVEARGVSRPIAMWLAMNVRPEKSSGRFVLRLDIERIRAMMNDYFARDLWPELEHPPERGGRPTEAHLIAGGRSDVLDAADLERARSLAHTTVDVIEEAGHWVHVDAPDALRELVLRHLASVTP